MQGVLSHHLSHSHLNSMNRKFICDVCSKRYSSRKSWLRHKNKDHNKSVPYRSYTLQPPNLKVVIWTAWRKFCLLPIKSLKNKKSRLWKQKSRKFCRKSYNLLTKKSEEEVEEEKTIKDIENGIFEYVTREERIRFHRLLDELKLCISRLKSKEIEKIDRIFPQYFMNE